MSPPEPVAIDAEAAPGADLTVTPPAAPAPTLVHVALRALGSLIAMVAAPPVMFLGPWALVGLFAIAFEDLRPGVEFWVALWVALLNGLAVLFSGIALRLLLPRAQVPVVVMLLASIPLIPKAWPLQLAGVALLCCPPVRAALAPGAPRPANHGLQYAFDALCAAAAVVVFGIVFRECQRLEDNM